MATARRFVDQEAGGAGMTDDEYAQRLEDECRRLTVELFRHAAGSDVNPLVKVYAAIHLVGELAEATTAWRPDQGPQIRQALLTLLANHPGLVDLDTGPDDGLRH